MKRQVLFFFVLYFFLHFLGSCKPSFSPEKLLEISVPNTPAHTTPIIPTTPQPITPLPVAPFPETPKDIIYIDNGSIRVGVNIRLGGAITFLATSATGKNLINNFDLGRQAQMSFYAGPVPYTPNGKQPKGGWEQVGWNPIQSGDIFGNYSEAITHTFDGNTIYVKAQPMQWALNNERADCFYETWISLEGNTVRFKGRLVANRSDKTWYDAKFQELLAVYTNATHRRIASYTGSKPFENDAIAYINTSANEAKYVEATENWVALLDDNNQGLGIWKANQTTFLVNSIDMGKGTTEQDPSAGYACPVQVEHLDHNIVYDVACSLVVGDLNDIRQYAYQHQNESSPTPIFEFNNNRQGWFFYPLQDTGFPLMGELNIRLNQVGNYIFSPSGAWFATKMPQLYLNAAITHPTATKARLYWLKYGDTFRFTEAQSITFDISADGRYRNYAIPLLKNPYWTGIIKQFLLAPIDKEAGSTNARVQIRKFSTEN